jgi:hypothetical protein
MIIHGRFLWVSSGFLWGFLWISQDDDKKTPPLKTLTLPNRSRWTALERDGHLQAFPPWEVWLLKIGW